MMTRKHFKAFATAVSEITDMAERRRVALMIAAVCRTDNPNFDTLKFMAACGLN